MMEEKARVLVVDDERVVREGCQRVLKGRGYEVLTAENGRVALDCLLSEQVEVLLLDLKMPIMGGEEVLEIARDKYADIPIIIITGHGTIDKAVECMKKGAYDFVTKPFQIEQFLLTINRALEKRRLEQKARVYEEERLRNLYDLGLEKSRLRTIIHCIPNGVMVTNRNLEVVLHNPALTRILEIATPLDGPTPLSGVLDNPTLMETLRQIQSGQCPADQFVSQEMICGKRSVRALSAAALGPSQEVVGTVTAFEDITAFKQLDDMKSDFIHMVAHELRSPVVSIRQQNSILLEGLAGPLQEKQKEILNRGIKKVDQLIELINDLLEIAKMEAAQQIQHRVPTDIATIIKETVALIEPRAKGQGIILEWACDNVRPIQADPKSLTEIFNNLITNAVNYSPEGGRVLVSAKGFNEYMEIKVSDTGVGIEPDELPKIFDKFYRVKHKKTRQIMGTGLGLAIVKKAVEAHHGAIDVESVPDKGTTFRILLPCIPDEIGM
jgi:two-component system, OmpR family, phosphate regulon sensor histidine kinase PhoR